MSDPDRPSDLQLVIGVSRESLALGSLKQVLHVNVYREGSPRVSIQAISHT